MSHVRTNAELTAATAVGLRWSALARVATELLLVGSMVVLARLIPPSAFGMVAIVLIVQELAVNVPSEGVGSPLVQRRSVDREHLQAGFALALVIGIVLAAVTLLLAYLLVKPVFGGTTATLVASTTPWFVFGALMALPLALLRRRLDFRRLALLGLIASIVRSVSSIVLAAVFGLDAAALVLGALAGVCTTTVLALIWAPVPLPRWRTKVVRDFLPYGGPAMIACFSWAGFRNGDYAMVGAQLGPTQAGMYWRGFQLSVEYQGKVSAVMNQVAFPVLSRTAGRDEMFVLRQRMVRLLTVVLFPVLAALAVMAPVLVPWMFGPDWEPAVVPTQILVGAGAATVVIDAVGSVLMSMGRARALLGYGVAHFAVYVCAILAVAQHGLAAVSGAAVLVHLIFVVVAYAVLLRGRPERTLRLLWEDTAAAFVSSAVLVAAAVPVALALGHADLAPPISLFVVGGVCAAAYLTTLRLGFPASWRDLMALVHRILPVSRLRVWARSVPIRRVPLRDEAR